SPFSPRPVVAVRVPAALRHAAPLRRAEQRLRAAWPDWLERAPTDVANDLTRAAGCAAAWALGALTEVRGFLHAAGARPSAGGSVAWVEFHRPEVSVAALRLAFPRRGRARRRRARRSARADPGLARRRGGPRGGRRAVG